MPFRAAAGWNSLKNGVFVPYDPRGENISVVTGGGGEPPPPTFTANFQEINPRGFSVKYADAGSRTFDPVGNPEFFTVNRQGFNSNGEPINFSENMVCTFHMWNTSPSNVRSIDEVASSDWLYSTDSIVGVINNSANPSPRPVANWALPDREWITGNGILRLEIVAFHRNGRDGKPVACVEFSVTDGTTTIVQKVSAPTILGRAGDRHPVIGYAANIDTTPFADESTLTCNAKVYPPVGDASSVLDSAAYAGSETHEFSPRFYRKRVANPFYIYVAPGGDDNNATVSTDAATARAGTKAATIIGAINRLFAFNTTINYGCIRLMDTGTHVFGLRGSPTRVQDHTHLLVEKDPLAPGAVRVEFGVTDMQPNLESSVGSESWLTFRNLTIAKMGTGVITRAGSGNPDRMRVWFDNCVLDSNTNATTWVGTSGIVKLMGTNVTLSGPIPGTTFGADTTSTPRWHMMRGLNISSVNTVSSALTLGCDVVGNTALVLGTQYDAVIIAYNEFRNVTGTFMQAVVPITRGFAFVQNIVDQQNGSVSQTIRIASDGASNSTNHVIFLHNTIGSGFYSNGRGNILYDDDITPRQHDDMLFMGNIHVQINCKGGEFDGQPTRNGHRGYYYGVGCVSEFSQFRDAEPSSGFRQRYPGLGAMIGTSATVRQDPGFVNYQGIPASAVNATGASDFHLVAGSVCKGKVPRTMLPWDLDGTPRSLTMASMGAYE